MLDATAKLIRWYQKPGERVLVDDLICEIETNAASMDIVAWKSGVLRQFAEPGEIIKPNAEIARIDDET